MSVSIKLLALRGHQKKEKKSHRRENSERKSSGHFSNDQHSSHYAYREVNGREQLGDGKGRRRRRRKMTQFGAAREVLHLNLWYFTSTISHILRKAKAFYNECCCDAYEDERMKKVEMALVDAYFSMPVLPYTTMANCM